MIFDVETGHTIRWNSAESRGSNESAIRVWWVTKQDEECLFALKKCVWGSLDTVDNGLFCCGFAVVGRTTGISLKCGNGCLRP